MKQKKGNATKRARIEAEIIDDLDEEFELELGEDVPEFERMLVRSGTLVIKYWFSITDDEQHLRFQMRMLDPLKQWKLSAMDLESRRRWDSYTKSKIDMFERTHIKEAPWWIVEAVDKKRARLNCIHHLLQQIPYAEVPHGPVTLPERVRDRQLRNEPISTSLYVPEIY
jgi:polyphosphate kinase